MRKETKELLVPKIDVVFHSLFRKENESITNGFLTDILQVKTKIIESEKDRHLETRYPEEKLGILDLRTELEGGTKCNVEIQLTNQHNTIKRILYYWSRIYSEQLKRGENYKELKKTISIMITDYEIEELKGIKELGTKWQIRDSQNGKRILTDDLEICIIEIPKARRIIEEEKGNKIAQWMMFLDNPNREGVKEIMAENENIKRAMKELEEMSDDEELRRVAELKEKYIRDEANIRESALEDGFNEGYDNGMKQGIKEGTEKGIQKGIQKGMQKGMQKGIQAGIQKGIEQEKRDIVVKMIKEKIPIETIIKITGLSKEEVEGIVS